MDMPPDMVLDEATGRWVPRIDPHVGLPALDQTALYPVTELDEELE
jgi:hypothetical protein